MSGTPDISVGLREEASRFESISSGMAAFHWSIICA